MFTRTFRVSAGSVAAALLITGVGATAADAKPVKPSPAKNLHASATEPAIGTYDVAAAWDAASNATSYKISVVSAGTTLATGKVTNLADPKWDGDVKATPGQVLTVTVRSVAGHVKSRPTSTTLTLRDLIAPSASYTPSWDNTTGDATLTESGLVDDSPVSGVTRTVDWGDGTTTSYAAGAPITHTYALTPAQEVRFAPTVVLQDVAGNSRTVDAPGIVFNDFTAPTGSFTVAPGKAWAKLTKVTVTQTALQDDRTPAASITRLVHWGDGTSTAWASGTTVSHVYKSGGSFTPQVTMTDEAHNAATEGTSAVTVKVDSTAPVVKLLLPRKKHSVKAWRTLRGTATDTAGTGVKRVSLRAVEKRSGHWFGYNANTHRWLRAATKAKAFARSRAFALTTNSRHRWAATLAGLRKGTLVYQVWATDKVNNRSVKVTHKTKLTKR